MRITVLFDNFGPYHLARLTAASGICELTAIELYATSQDYRWRREDRSTTFARRTIFRSDRDRCGGILQSARTVAIAVEETKPHVVAIPGWSGWHAFAALHWCAINHVPAVVMSESTPDDEPHAGWKEWIKRRYVGLCSAALVGGNRHRDYLVQLGMPAERIFFGYDVVDNRYFAERADEVRHDPVAWRERLAVPDRYFLAAARFIEKKNLPNLLRAYATYRAACRDRNAASLDPAWDLVILGDGERQSQLYTLRQQLELTSCVHFPGFKQYDELPPYFALANAFIHPSTSEPWGLVVNEAMAAQLPVLVSNRCGCAPTLVREGENGLTFDPNDLAAMTQCMLAMTQSSDEPRQEMGRRSGEVIAEFGPERFADGLRQAAAVSLACRAKPHSAWDLFLLRSLLLKNVKVFRQRSSR